MITKEDFAAIVDAEPLDSRVAAIKLGFMVEKLLSERDEALKRIEDFRRRVIPCVICEYKEGILEKKCWLHENLEEALNENHRFSSLIDTLHEFLNEEKRWKEAYREFIKTLPIPIEVADMEAKRIFEETR